tara:strand:- start:255 stop:638 length:384 start_codon:yes stop_codon:yes gene_type:complete
MLHRTSFFKDFQTFISKGNVVDLAIAVIIAEAFGKIVNSVVTLITTKLLEPALKAAQAETINSWPAGSLIVAIINFAIIAFVCFIIVRAFENLKRKEKVIEEKQPDPNAQLASAITRLSDLLEKKGV